MEVSENGLKLIEEFEGVKLTAYLCPANIPTIGVGSTRYNDGTKVKLGDKITEEQAYDMLEYQIKHTYGKAVNEYVTESITQNEFDALVSFTWNLGAGNLKSSTLLKKLNAGDHQGAADEFLKWTKSGGKVLKGLVRRREAERALFLRRG